MVTLNFKEKDFLAAASREEDFTNTPDGSFEPGAETYLREFYSDAQENDFLYYSLKDLVTLARDFWMFGNRRKPDTILLDVVISPTPLGAERSDTAIRIITEDMAFLVDSLVATVSSFGINVNGLFRPIVRGNRGDDGRWLPERKDETAISESMILVMIPPQNASTRLELKNDLQKTLEEVQRINRDFKPLVESVKMSAVELSQSRGVVDEDEVDEAVAFLDWIADGNFVFFGSRRYDYMNSDGRDGPSPDYVNPSIIDKYALGILKDTSLSILRQGNEPSFIASNVNAFIENQPPVTVAKSNLRSRVHRRVYMDYVSVKHYDHGGMVTGETRYVGLFTSNAYDRSPRFVPLLRRKVERVLEAAELNKDSHNYRRLQHVLESYPRDELFQIGHKDLSRISRAIAQAFDRPRTRLFIRRDPFDRFVSVLVYVPQEHYNTRVRERIGKCLKDAFNGRVSAFYPQYSDASLVRVHFIIGMDRTDVEVKPDLDALEKQVAAISKPWFTNVALLADNKPEQSVAEILTHYKDAFTLAYQETFDAKAALRDIMAINSVSGDAPIALDVYDVSRLHEGRFEAKIYHLGSCLELSSIIPMFANFGCDVIQETAYPVKPRNHTTVWVHNFEFRIAREVNNAHDFGGIFARAFIATWTGRNEDDGFNRLILPQGRGWRDIAFLRLLSRYRRQSGLDPSEPTQVEALERYPELTKLLLDLKQSKFDPDAFDDWDKRRITVSQIKEKIQKALNGVKSIEHDRVIRRLAECLGSALRTNFYQSQEYDGGPKPYISVKFDSQLIEDLPAPKPYREIYVSSPIVEGVHLRFGPVARGGLRWSDRRDDFRTEVLGLVKAQQVKNAVIVPVGSKGGFFPKNLPEKGSRDEIRESGVTAYKTFIRGLLDLTDNYEGEHIVTPENVISWDGSDPYLVVAADKGTATFSDVANGISQEYGFWLGDAFASGGSAGYDHKAMGITARGGWEAVKRHFREMGKDIQSEDFTVLGVGDMSGDVFGNGMLLSKHIRLVAAFNHMHIFIDPDPDAAESFEERQRLFRMDRSTWEDYNPDLISRGGGIFSRSSKSIDLSDEMKAMTGLPGDTVAPDDLIHALLKSDVELLWFGGIGTYVKSSHESHYEVGDKTNESLRVDGRELKAKVIGEGANLGVTQAGRIEYARTGGRVNTDAIDNSAGVDSSDNEVNIKILLSGAIESESLKAEERNSLLAKLTDNVAELVLQHNYDQTGMLSLAEFRAARDHDAYERLMLSLEKRGELNRDVEDLPSSETMQTITADTGGLARPEIAVLMAYAKNILFEDVIDTDVADDPYMDAVLLRYFPAGLARFATAMDGHRLRREIITSRLVNTIIDVGGPVFPLRLQEQTQGQLPDIAKSFVVAYDTLGIENLRRRIKNLDNKVDAEAQIELHDEITRVMQRVTAWLVRRNEAETLQDRIDIRASLREKVDNDWLDFLSSYDRHRATTRIRDYKKSRIPEDLAVDVAMLRSCASGFNIVELSRQTGWTLDRSAVLFHDIGGRLRIDRVRAALLATDFSVHWERLAISHMQEDFFKAQAKFAFDAAEFHTAKNSREDDDMSALIQNWIDARVPNIRAYENTVKALLSSGGWTVAKFAIFNAKLSDLMVHLT